MHALGHNLRRGNGCLVHLCLCLQKEKGCSDSALYCAITWLWSGRLQL